MLVEMKTSTEHREEGDSGVDQSSSTEGAAGKAVVPPSSELSDGEDVAEHRGGGIPAEGGKHSNS